MADSGEEKGETITAPVSSINNFNTYEIGDEVQIYKMTDIATGETTYETTAILSVIIPLILFYLFSLK